GYHCDGVRRESGFERRNGLAQHASENVGCRAHPAILQQMDQFAQSTFITAISGGARKSGFDAPAQPTARFALGTGERVRGKKPLATYGANSARDRAHGVEAILA